VAAKRPRLALGIVPARNPASDYADVLRKLLPRGRVWTREDEGTQAAVLDALAITAEGLDSEALTLIAAAFPATADQLLPEWDETLGLPDACFGPFTSQDENRQQVVAKLIGAGGQSIAYFESLAASLGYTITIKEFSVHTVISPVTAPIAGPVWGYTWQVVIGGPYATLWFEVDDTVDTPLSSRTSAPVTRWHRVTDTVGDALSSHVLSDTEHWHTVDDPVEDPLSSSVTAGTETLLECLLRRYAPAHTVVIFEYTSA
jgi:uncharacterized protein YmfQ (DUF2313 family)